MLKGLKQWAAGRIILVELRGLRVEVSEVKGALARIADALEQANQAQGFAPAVAPLPDDLGTPRVSITYADDAVSREFMEIEAALIRATGRIPDEAQVFEEFERRHVGDLQSGGPLGSPTGYPAERS